jgi:hypothetical protein
MAFRLRTGLPEMAAFWEDLVARKQQGRLDAGEEISSQDDLKHIAGSRLVFSTPSASNVAFFCGRAREELETRSAQTAKDQTTLRDRV